MPVPSGGRPSLSLDSGPPDRRPSATFAAHLHRGNTWPSVAVPVPAKQLPVPSAGQLRRFPPRPLCTYVNPSRTWNLCRAPVRPLSPAVPVPLHSLRPITCPFPAAILHQPVPIPPVDLCVSHSGQDYRHGKRCLSLIPPKPCRAPLPASKPVPPRFRNVRSITGPSLGTTLRQPVLNSTMAIA